MKVNELYPAFTDIMRLLDERAQKQLREAEKVREERERFELSLLKEAELKREQRRKNRPSLEDIYEFAGFEFPHWR
jgi:hypothetical protein